MASEDRVALASPAPILVARQLCKTYRMGDTTVHALRNVGLDLARGELVVILGASGSGKSTLLNIIGGLDRPSSGQMLHEGRDLARIGETELTRYRRENVGFVFQFYNLISSLTARENVALVTDIAQNPMQPEEALAMVGLDDRVNHFPSQMSGGEQQRVAIARAVAKRPRVLLCDEPTGALDSVTGKLVLSVLERVNRELGTTTVIITHNAAIGALADRVMHMGSGEISEITYNPTRAPVTSIEW